jgi:F-type H+-transporting ATPase subunit gamma
MALNLQLLKGRIRTANNIAQIAKTLEMISAIKIRRAQSAMENAQPYAARVNGLVRDILGRVEPSRPVLHPYVSPAPGGTRLILAIGPDKGLCGPLPANLARELRELDDPDVLLVTVGRKIEKAAAGLKKSRLIAAFSMGSGIPQYSLVGDLIRTADEYVMRGKASSFSALFTRYVSYFSQIPVEVSILPIEAPSAPHRQEPYAVEPDVHTALAALLPHYLEVTLYSLLVEAHVAEQSARLVAMQNAKNNATDTADALVLRYNKGRQERITSEILDLANQGDRDE